MREWFRRPVAVTQAGWPSATRAGDLAGAPVCGRDRRIADGVLG